MSHYFKIADSWQKKIQFLETVWIFGKKLEFLEKNWIWGKVSDFWKKIIFWILENTLLDFRKISIFKILKNSDFWKNTLFKNTLPENTL